MRKCETITTLSESKDVRKINNTVLRPSKVWSPNIQQFLYHLEANQLPVEHMERIENGNEIYAYVEAEMVHPHCWSDDSLYELGKLLRRLHAAGAAFTADADLGYKAWCLREIGGANRIWCHGDIAPWNMLTKNGMPFVLVDWEFTGPLDPLVELARVCWLFVQLHDDDLKQLYDLPSVETRAKQVRLICDAYELDKKGRERLIEQIIEVIICETAHEAIDSSVTFDSTGCLWGFAWRTRSLYWVWRNKDVLCKALK